MSFTDAMTPEEMAKAENGGMKFINESGVYFGEITEATYTKTPNGAGYLNLSIKTDDDKECNYMQTLCVQKDGKDAFGMAFYKFACKTTGSKMEEPVQSKSDTKVFGFPSLYGKKIGVGVQVEWKNEFNEKGYQKSQKNIVAVYDYATKRSAAEVAENKNASKFMVQIIDKGVKLDSKPVNSGSFSGPIPSVEDELPF